MAAAWFIRSNGKVHGPLDSAKLKQLVAAGKIDQTSEVAQNENGPWVPAGRVKGLFAQPDIPAAPPPPIETAATTPAVPQAKPSHKNHGGYVDSNLLPNEHVVYRAGLHWLYFLRPVLWFVVAFVLFRTGARMGVRESDAGLGAIVFGVFCVFGGILSAINRAVNYMTSEFAVTNRRVIMKQGFIRRKTLELMLGKVDSLGVDQGILGRVFGFGTVRVTVATEKQTFSFLAKPLEFRRQVQAHTPS